MALFCLLFPENEHIKDNMNFEDKKIAVIGLGYVGLPLAIEFGKIRKTFGFDINEKRIEELKDGFDSTLEVSKEDFKKSLNLRLTSKVDDLKSCEIFIITVPTPVDEIKKPNLKPLRKACETIASVLKKNDCVIFESTVFPGCTEEFCVPILEKNSGLIYNEDFFCGYSPERINPGDKVNTLKKIKKITSGSNEEVATKIDNMYLSIIDAGTFKAKSIRVAEAAKVIENTQRDLNIALINELSVIFNRLDIDTIDVLDAAGSKWNFLRFLPGMVGGHCIGVDPYYLTYKAEQVNYNPQVILAGRRINDNMAQYAAKIFVQKMIQKSIDISKAKIGVMGITFKDNCPDIRNTKIIDLINELKRWNIKEVLVTDPWANEKEVKNLLNIKLCPIEDFNNLDSIVVAVSHNEFIEIPEKRLRSFCSSANPVIADLKSIYNKDSLEASGFDVFRL